MGGPGSGRKPSGGRSTFKKSKFAKVKGIPQKESRAKRMKLKHPKVTPGWGHMPVKR